MRDLGSVPGMTGAYCYLNKISMNIFGFRYNSGLNIRSHMSLSALVHPFVNSGMLNHQKLPSVLLQAYFCHTV